MAQIQMRGFDFIRQKFLAFYIRYGKTKKPSIRYNKAKKSGYLLYWTLGSATALF
jgi:hypothetical protein